MIIVGKKWDKGAIYIGRGSPLGNPFIMKQKKIETLFAISTKSGFISKLKERIRSC